MTENIENTNQIPERHHAKIRNKIQVAIIKEMVGPGKIASEMEWYDRYGQKVTALLDDPVLDDEIEKIAKDGDYALVANFIIKQLTTYQPKSE